MIARSRLSRVERAVRARTPAPEARQREDEDWLAVFEAMGRDGNFDLEPDFPEAIDFYRRAIAAAKARVDPPFEPPADFRPDSPRSVRLINWRSKERFPDVWAGFDWVGELFQRRCDGIPPVSDLEFQALRAWFETNEAGLRERQPRSQLFDVGGGRSVTLCNLRYGLRLGPRAGDAGRVAEDVRQLRQRYLT